MKKPRTAKQIEWAKKLGQNSQAYKMAKQAKTTTDITTNSNSPSISNSSNPSGNISLSHSGNIIYIIIGIGVLGTYFYFHKKQMPKEKPMSKEKTEKPNPNFFEME